MGQRMPDEPIEFGVNCDGGFPPGLTPKFLFVRFSSLVQCPDIPPITHTTPPNDRAFKLEQVAGIPCRWEFFDAKWFIQFTFSLINDQTVLFIVNNDDGATYFGDILPGPPGEGVVYLNDITVCGLGFGAKDGIAVVTWTPQATQILEDINLEKANDLFMELRPLIDGKLVYKFTTLKDSTNIAILFEP